MSKLIHTCACPAHAFDRSWFDQTTEAINDAVHTAAAATRTSSTPTYRWAYLPHRSRAADSRDWDTCANIEHAWHPSLVARFKLHPVVDAMLAYKPESVAQLCLEWPHVSEGDSNLLAYTRDDSKGHADVQTTTKIGKYVARHWPHIPDHIRRDVCSLYTPDKCSFVPADVDSFIAAVQRGPKSCMQDTFDVHPYTVYDPALGWGMAVRRTGDSIDGRALTYIDPEDEAIKKFVRTYSRTESNGYSQADEVLASWLVSQGYTKVNSWSDCKVAAIQHNDLYVMPYIDGGSQEADLCSDGKTFCITHSGDYKCDKQSGYCESGEESIGECEDCGNTLYEGDDFSHVGQYEDCMICDSCCNGSYTYVTGQCNRGRIREYYVRDDRAISVDGENYDSENLPDNICQLEDGDYFDSDTAEYCTIDDEYYLCDDDRVVLCEDGEHRLLDECVHCADGNYRPAEECWQCEGSSKWYSDDEESIELDGETYHPDYLAELVASKQVAPLFAELV